MTTQQYMKFISGLGICLILFSQLTNSAPAATSRFPSEVHSDIQAISTTLTQLWPDALIGIWGGTINYSVLHSQGTSQAPIQKTIEIQKTSDGRMIVVEDDFPDIEQGSYKNSGIDDGDLYYCFNVYSYSGDKQVIGERCFEPINENQLKYFGWTLNTIEYGLLIHQPSLLVNTPSPTPSLNRSDFISVVGWLSYAISHNQPDMIADLIGENGTRFWYYAVGATPMGYNNSKTIVSELRKGLDGSSPQCLGYNKDEGPTSAIIIFKGIHFDWVGLGLSEPENNTVGFGFGLSEKDWVLMWITPMPNFFWSDYHMTLEKCPSDQSVKSSTPVANSFSNGDAIQIGSDVYIIIDGQRRLIPNPETLYALGIQNSSINNKGFSEADLSTIPQGDDIPDVNKDPSGLAAFINQYFPSTSPSPSPAVPTPKPWYCSILPLFCPTTVLASTNTDCHPQCVEETRLKRPDLNIWASDVHVADTILARAQTQPIFPQNNMQMQVRVREQNEQPQTGDIIIWPSSSCQGVYAPVDKNGNKLPGGHIGYVASHQDGHLIVHDANWDNKCGIRSEEIKLNACLKFITSPYQVGSLQSIPTPTQPADPCSQYSGFRLFVCKYLGIK
jgi:hypothetical protein